MMNATLFSLAIAAGLDYAIGDPWGWPHPVQAMGWAIDRYTKLALRCSLSPAFLRLAGVGLAVGVIGLSGCTGWLLVGGAQTLHPALGIGMESVLLAACFAGRSLRAAAEDVLQALATGDLSLARTRLSLYVGRDTDTLEEPDILRAVLETITENATDGVMAPLFYGILGALLGLVLPGVNAAAFALSYKAASTLDSMVGYRRAPYEDLGWFSARLEDYLTWLPCRLTVMTVALLSGKPRRVWQLCCRDAPADPSPNSGWSECAYAAALGVQVGGDNWYKGVVKHKPLLGESQQPITPVIIQHAFRFTRWCFLIWLSLGLLILSLSILYIYVYMYGSVH